MDKSEETNNDKHMAAQSLCPTASSEEELDEARRKNAFRQLYGSSKIFLAPTDKHPQRPDLQGKLIIQNKAAEHYRNGKEAMEQFQYEKAIICFSKAIFLQPEQTELYVSQGEVYLQLCDFQSAAACYKQASALQPGAFNDRLGFIYYLQGQCLFDQGLFLEAQKAFSRAIEMKPESKAYEHRHLACLIAAGRHTECLKLLTDGITKSPTADRYVLRAQMHKLMHQINDCRQDAKSALVLNPKCPEAKALLLQLQEASEEARQQAVDRTLLGQLHEALCLINVALEYSPQDGRLYLFRGTLYRRLKDFTAATEDLIQAVELSEEEEGRKEVKGQAGATDKKDESNSVQEDAQFQLVLTNNDFAVQCISKGLYDEATLLLNKAIDGEKGLPCLYLNRGDCFFKLGKWHYAQADYQQAEEMLPDDPAVWNRLAVIHNTLGFFYFQHGYFRDAVDMLSLAIRYNPTASRYYESRSKAFRKLLHLREAREDFICLLILDPSNEEVPPMLMSLFPGSSTSDILSSPKGQTMKVQLMDTIQAWRSSSDPQRLNESFPNMTLTDENTASRSEDTAAEKELSSYANLQDLQTITKDLLRVREKVEAFVRDHPTLVEGSGSLLATHEFPPLTTSTGPSLENLRCLRLIPKK
ncbi:tetratricopeptide repeat protein 16-like [Leuresthes tenuis]|uniref:tetratricopeptide repeat protein 16-like n=1 Tax=Leuresthes tenuis TaxID=355514 RepID=UPI003B511449